MGCELWINSIGFVQFVDERNSALTQQPAADIFTVSGARRNFIGNLCQPVKISKNPIGSQKCPNTLRQEFLKCDQAMTPSRKRWIASQPS